MNDLKKILVVDDDDNIRELLQRLFQEDGWHCQAAESGSAALQVLEQSSPFDLMITDIVMEGMNGIELTRQVQEKYPSLPVIVMTGFTEDYNYDEAVKAGAADFVKKPFTMREIMVRIHRVLRDQQTVEAIRRKEKELERMGSEMIAGVQDESRARIDALQKEIAVLKKKIW
ncbi:response regulator [Thermodesulfobacteriota bacterium]